jgi:hypothetical protein
MNRIVFSRGISLVLLLTMLAGWCCLPARAAGGGNLYITGYTVADSTGKTMSSVTKGATVNIVVSVKDTGDGKGDQDPKQLDITKLDDSFTGGSVSVEKSSAADSPLVYAVTFSGVKYKGVGQTLRFQIGTAGQPESYQTMEVTITEAVVYEAPPAPTPEPPSPPEPSPAPMVLVSRSELARPIEAGQELELTLSFRNLSNSRLTSPVVTVTPSEGLSLTGGSSSFLMDDIAGKKAGSIKVGIKAGGVIPSASQSLSVELKFNYHNGVSIVQGTMSDKVAIPAVARDSVPQPVVVVTRTPLEKPLSAGQVFNVTLSFKNAGKTRMISPVATVSSSDALVILNDASTFLLGDIEPGKSGTVTVKLQASKEISSPNQSLSTELKYSYDNGGTITQATASDRVNLSANVTGDGQKTDAPAPNIVISKFSYGADAVAAGSKFPLSFTFENTGTLKIENVVVTVDGGESFAMDGSTNTFFYKSLPAGSAQTQAVPMQAVPNGKSGAQSVNVGFKYEYVDGAKRTQATADIKISIPLYQPDRFQLNAPVLPESVNVGEELELTVAYVNKGKDDIANVEATVEGEGIDVAARTLYVGNITAGTSGNIGFAVTPSQEGELNLILKISYENANQELQTREFPVTLQAEEPVLPDDFGDEEVPEEGGFPWLWVILGGIVVIGAGAVVILRRRKAAVEKQAATPQDWDDWDENQAENSAAEDAVEDTETPGGEA